jgi:hypothetical protein
MLIQKLGAFGGVIAGFSLTTTPVVFGCVWSSSLCASLFCCFVVGTTSGIARLATWHQVVEFVGAASINFNDVICFGGFAFLAPMAHRVVFEYLGPCFSPPPV